MAFLKSCEVGAADLLGCERAASQVVPFGAFVGDCTAQDFPDVSLKVQNSLIQIIGQGECRQYFLQRFVEYHIERRYQTGSEVGMRVPLLQ